MNCRKASQAISAIATRAIRQPLSFVEGVAGTPPRDVTFWVLLRALETQRCL
jgi:hypothetical protein